jgi:hypothetical protein
MRSILPGLVVQHDARQGGVDLDLASQTYGREHGSGSELMFYCEQRRGSKGAYGRRVSVEQTSWKEGICQSAKC